MNDDQKKSMIGSSEEDLDIERKVDDQAVQNSDQEEQQEGELDTRTNKGRNLINP